MCVYVYVVPAFSQSCCPGSMLQLITYVGLLVIVNDRTTSLVRCSADPGPTLLL